MRCDIIYQPTTRDYFPSRRSFAFYCHQLRNEDRLMNVSRLELEKHKKKNFYDFKK